MTQVTKPIALDETLQRVASALEKQASVEHDSYTRVKNAEAAATAAQTQAAAAKTEAQNAAANAAKGIEGVTGKLADLKTNGKTNLVAAINEVKQATLDNAKSIMNVSKNDASLPTTYTLEQSSNPAFEVTNPGAAKQVVNNMGGYLFLNKDGKTYAAKLGPDWSTLLDGTPVTASLEAKTETMIHLPKVYYEGQGKTVKIYGLQGPSTAKTYDGPHWIGAYIASGNSNGLHSRPNTTPAHSQTMSTFQSWAQKLGTDWGQWQYESWKTINLLLHATYGNLNLQEVIGAGWQHSDWTHCRDVPMGLCKSLGDGSGSVLYNDATVGNQYPVKLFGFEDLWGKLWQFTPGIRYYMDGDVRHAVIYSGNIVSNTAEGRDVSPVLKSASGTYASKMHLGEYCDMICQEANGSSNTYYCDGYWAAEGGQLLIVGADARHGARCGLGYSNSYDGFSNSPASIGARLAFYNEPVIVSGRELVTLAGA